MDDYELNRSELYALVAERDADLAEARADVARFEAALDAVNRELAQARKWSSAWKAAAKDRRDDGLDTLSCNHRLSVEGDRLRAELAQARAERDAAVRQRDFAKDGEDNMRFLKVLWENECGFYRAQSVARFHEIELGRRTIRALVVACRAIHRTLWQALDQYEVNDRGIVRDMRQHVIGLNIKQAKQSGQQAGE